MNARDLRRKPLTGPRVCPGCGEVYNRFRCDLGSFRSVRAEMWHNSENPNKWRHKRRRGVLGYWRQLKSAHWNWHIKECEAYHSQGATMQEAA